MEELLPWYERILTQSAAVLENLSQVQMWNLTMDELLDGWSLNALFTRMTFSFLLRGTVSLSSSSEVLSVCAS